MHRQYHERLTFTHLFHRCRQKLRLDMLFVRQRDVFLYLLL